VVCGRAYIVYVFYLGLIFVMLPIRGRRRLFFFEGVYFSNDMGNLTMVPLSPSLPRFVS